DPYALQDLRRKIDDQVVDAAVLPRHRADGAFRRPRDHARAVADARVEQQPAVRRVARAGGLAIVVPHGNARLDVIAGEPDRPIADPLVERDAARAGDDAQDAVAADPVRTGPADERVADLSSDDGRDERVGVDARRAGSDRAHWSESGGRHDHTWCQKICAPDQRSVSAASSSQSGMRPSGGSCGRNAWTAASLTPAHAS